MTQLLSRFAALPPTGHDPGAALTVRPGTVRDYDILARFHYRPTRPATIARILTMCDGEWGGEPIAVLVISRPMLNAPWRPIAWQHLATGDKRQRARAANQFIRTISRIIVDPRWRGMGTAKRLIRAYLSDPLTPHTETLATMARFCPCFAAAGMQPCPVPTARHDARLRRALSAAQLHPWQLLDSAVKHRLAAGHPLARALRTWARATRAHRAIADGPLSDLALRAAGALAAERIVYLYTKFPDDT